MAYKSFVKALCDLGVTNALYLDMGEGWNYSFYRDNDGKVNFIHNRRTFFTTNRLTIYR